jgi:hypothetical protein
MRIEMARGSRTCRILLRMLLLLRRVSSANDIIIIIVIIAITFGEDLPHLFDTVALYSADFKQNRSYQCA